MSKLLLYEFYMRSTLDHSIFSFSTEYKVLLPWVVVALYFTPDFIIL